MAKKERWASRVGLVLAMAGNAVGLGNFLRFPAQAAANGGGAFLIPYFVALLLLGLPLVWIEWTMGRYGGQFGHHSTPGIFQKMGKSPAWKYLGVFGLWSNLMIASYYLYIETWTLAYAGNSLLGGFAKTSGGDFFNWLTGETKGQLLAISGVGLALFAVCIVLNIVILAQGLSRGIEIVSKIGMPLLIVFAAILAVRGLMIGPDNDEHAVASAWTGLNFVWQPKFDSLMNPAVWLAAAGQIFFTLSLGMGSVHCYASYLRETDDVALTGTTAAWTNEFCEVILGGSIVLPIAVAYMGVDDVSKTGGFDLGFKVLPQLFQDWGWLARPAGFLWFGLLFFAAITSSLAMGQPIMAFLQSEFHYSRSKSAWMFGLLLLPLALCVACLTQGTFFGEFDYWAGTFALVLFALIETILFSWVFGIERGWEQLMQGAELRIPRFYRYILKYVTPTLLIVILLASTFLPAAGWAAYAKAIVGGAAAPDWEWSGDGLIGKLLHKDLTLAADATPEERSYNEQLQLLRTIDRAVIVTTWLFFAALVALAWKRRRDEGRETN